ncbi:hypothetical protein HZS_5788 [Henneguya salminicola]|nr:hypothetical protein HZS_5788 [Henneguya salminicola]
MLLIIYLEFSDNKTIMDIDWFESMENWNGKDINLTTLEIHYLSSIEQPKKLSPDHVDNLTITPIVKKKEHENTHLDTFQTESTINMRKLKDKKYKLGMIFFEIRWYFSEIDRITAEEILKKARRPRSFLIRRSKNPSAPFILSIFNSIGKTRHYLIKYKPVIGYIPPIFKIFSEVELLVDFFQSTKNLHACNLERDDLHHSCDPFRGNTMFLTTLHNGSIPVPLNSLYD